MPPELCVVACGELNQSVHSQGEGDRFIPLQIGQGKRDVHLRLDHVSHAMKKGLPPLAADMLELAAYIFAADQNVSRGGTGSFDYGNRWRRNYRFHIPVRCPEIWNRTDVQIALQSALQFLTDDNGYDFVFSKAKNPKPPEGYLFDEGQESNPRGFEDVVLFSGGLDSLCGAVDQILVSQRRVVLVSHRPSNPQYARQRDLVAQLRGRLKRSDLAPHHVAVTINEGVALNHDFTQRSRSFIVAVTAAVVARQLELSKIWFCENGATSFNLPISPQLTGARTSRTTHPQTLARFGNLLSLLFGIPFEVQNPYQWSTKAELLARLKQLGHADLCPMTVSCVRSREHRIDQPHCGVCSQCVDRRLSVISAGLTNDDDPISGYQSDVMTGPRDGVDLTLVERYAGAAFEMESITSPLALASNCGEINHILPYVGMRPNDAAYAVFDLQRRHSAGVREAIQSAVGTHVARIVRHELPANSLLGVVLGWRFNHVTMPSSPPESSPSEAEGPFEVDDTRFELRLRGQEPCFLGNTKEFCLISRLWRSHGHFVSIPVLGEDVWDNSAINKNTVQKTASNLRRRLRESSYDEVVIGSEKGVYGLFVGIPIPEPARRRRQRVK